MKIKIIYNNELENTNLPKEKEFEKFIEELKCNQVFFYNNIARNRRWIDEIINKTNNGKKLTHSDFCHALVVLLVANDDTQEFVRNAALVDIKPAIAASKRMLEHIKLIYEAVILKLSDVNNNEDFKRLGEYKTKLCLADIKNIASMIFYLEYMHNSDKVSKTICDTVLFNLFSELKNTIYVSDETVSDSKKVVEILKCLSKNISRKQKIDYDSVKKLKGDNLRWNIDFEKTLSQYVIEMYNNEIEDQERKKQENSIEKVLINETSQEDIKVVYTETEIKLTEDDLLCLDMYLDIITDLVDKKISMEDFEYHTANYLDYVEGTHYKEILEELVRKIQNDTSISSSVKKKCKKIIGGLIRAV